MKIEIPENYEARSFTGSVEVRSREDGSATIRGLAVVYDSMSENLGGFREVIAKGALEETDMSDVRGLFNHDSNFVLGRNRSNTLRLTRTDQGLEYEIDLPNTQTIRDLVFEPIKRGDVDQSSFGFIIGRGNDDWDENEDGVVIRTIRKIKSLFDVSPVTFPAYQDTSVGARSMQRWQEAQEQNALQQKQQHDENRSRQVTLEHLSQRIAMPGISRR